MCGHIVGALVVVDITRVIFRNGFIEVHFKVLANGWVGVLVDAERGGCMLDEDLAHAGFDSADLRNCTNNFFRNEVVASFSLAKSQRLLIYLHFKAILIFNKTTAPAHVL